MPITQCGCRTCWHRTTRSLTAAPRIQNSELDRRGRQVSTYQGSHSGTPASPSRAFRLRFASVACGDGLRPLPARWCRSASGDCPARHPCRSWQSLIRRLVVGRFAPARYWFQCNIAPIASGGRYRPDCVIGGGYAAFMRLFPLPSPGGGNGELKAKRRVSHNCKTLPLVARKEPPFFPAEMPREAGPNPPMLSTRRREPRSFFFLHGVGVERRCVHRLD